MHANACDRTIYITTTIRPSLTLLITIAEQFTASIDELKPIAGLVYSLSFQPLTTSLLTASQAHSPNSFGLHPKDGPLLNVLILASWANKADDGTVERAALAFIKQIDQLAQEGGVSVEYKLLTYTYPGQDVIGSYGKANVDMLRSVSEKYDPQGVFQKGTPGGFKVFPHPQGQQHSGAGSLKEA